MSSSYETFTIWTVVDTNENALVHTTFYLAHGGIHLLFIYSLTVTVNDNFLYT